MGDKENQALELSDDDIYDLCVNSVLKFVNELEFPYNFIQPRHHMMMTGSMLILKIIGLIPFLPWIVVFLPTFMSYLITTYLVDAVFTITKEGTENAKKNSMHTQTLPEDNGGIDKIDESGIE